MFFECYNLKDAISLDVNEEVGNPLLWLKIDTGIDYLFISIFAALQLNG